jgi:acetyl-CoA acetyltransferase
MGENGAAVANLSAACAAGGAAVSQAASLVGSGSARIVLVIGAERMPRGFIARPPGGSDEPDDVEYLRWVATCAPNTVYWALEARRRMHERGTTALHLARVAAQAHEIGQHNPRARFRARLTVDEIMGSAMVSDPLHRFEVCAVSDGAAALVVCDADTARRSAQKAIWIRASVVSTGLFGDPTIRIPELSATPRDGVPAVSECTAAARKAFAASGVGPEDIDFLELQDNSSWQQLELPELFGLCKSGEAEALLDSGQTLPTGRLPLNPSGGFLSFGEATTAMGVWQVCESVWQLRGEAGARQVPGARIGMCQVLGLEGNGVVTILAS